MNLTHRNFLRCAALSMAALVAACSSDDDDDNNLNDSAAASTYESDVVSDWFDGYYTWVKALGANPLVAARIYATAGVALYESVVPGMRDHVSLEGQLNDLVDGSLPDPANAIHHWPSAANRALAVVAASYFPAQQTNIDALELQYATLFEADASSTTIDRSIAFGQDVAAAVLAWVASDGADDLAACNAAFVPPIDHTAGGWIPSGMGTLPGLAPCWGSVRTMGVGDSSECTAAAFPVWSIDPASAFYANGLIVANTTGVGGANLSSEQLSIALFWADNPTMTGTPGGHWVAICAEVLRDEGVALDVAAEAIARMTISQHDGFITCWQTKFLTCLERPITYIQENIDPLWTPVITTPNFPTYTSGHSTQSGAASTALQEVFGSIDFVDDVHSRLNPELVLGDPLLYADRTFANFAAAANQAGLSRVYGGIHWVFDSTAGLEQGACVANVIDSRIQFRAE